MKYLLLRFESACLRYADVSLGREGKLGLSSLKNINDFDWSCPIGLDQVSNMLHVMFGLAPKAVNRSTVFKRNKEIYELAKSSYIKYDNYSKEVIEDAKYVFNLEFFQSAKAAYNSHSKINTIIEGKEIHGHYTWDYFERRFKGQEDLLKEIMDFFNDVLGVSDVRKYYYFPEFIEEFHKHLKEKKVKDFFKNRLYQGGDFFGTKKPLNTSVVSLLKNEYDPKKITNCSYNNPTPLLYTHGTGRKFAFYGEILVPLNDEYAKHLEKWGTLPTILDGGLINVVSLTNKIPYNKFEFENDFVQLSDVKKWRN